MKKYPVLALITRIEQIVTQVDGELSDVHMSYHEGSNISTHIADILSLAQDIRESVEDECLVETA